MTIPEMIKVSSSNVDSVGYSADSETVFIKFLDERIYIYKGVPSHEFENLKNAPSVGSYLHRNFRNIYPYERFA